MRIYDDFTAAIGNTPLIKLRRASEETGCTILGKAEFLNPGGSVKDRAAKYIILDAEARGDLEPGGLIVEGTAGNTGIGLASVGNARGYRTTIVIPESQAEEKKAALRMLGAEVIENVAVPFKDPRNYVHTARAIAEDRAKTEQHGVLYANQWDNTSNREAHIRSTGPEIWEQTAGKIDGFSCAIGTGGTLSGMALYLKEKNKDIQVVAADPMGAAMYSYIKTGALKGDPTGSISEGIGQGRITGNISGVDFDDAYKISDEEALPIVHNLMREEGLCMGLSTGVNIAGAMHLAKELGPGHTIVTILCDWGHRYQAKVWNPAFLKEKGLPVPAWMEAQAVAA